MNRIAIAILPIAALVCAMAALTPAGAGGSQGRNATQAARDAVVKAEERWLANEDNPAVLDSILADDFVHVLAGGFITKQQHIDYVRAHPFPRLKTHRFEKLDVRVYRNAAIANGIVLAVPLSGATTRTYFTDVFVLRDGHWQAVNAQESVAGATAKP